MFVAGESRSPSAFDIHLTYREYILEETVMKSLKLAEEKYSKVGRSLLSTFFPSELRDQEEVEYWREMRRIEKERYEALTQTKAP